MFRDKIDRRSFLRRSGAFALKAAALFGLASNSLILSACSRGNTEMDKRQKRIEKSPNWDGKMFKNIIETDLGLQPLNLLDTTVQWFFGGEEREPKKPIPIVTPEPGAFAGVFDIPSPSSLRVTWLGHSTLLFEIDGQRILVDPIWSKRCSPLASIGIGHSRFHPPPIPISELPKLDAVLISHDHFDHLDKSSILTLAKTGVPFYMPLGVGRYFQDWEIPEGQYFEHDWWESDTIPGGEIEIVATPARHFSGRNPLFGKNPTLWASWAIIGPKNRVFFSGDSGMLDTFGEIGKRYGPFDLTAMEIGASDKNWAVLHFGPDSAVDAHIALKGKVTLPIHWGTFNLAFHHWYQPIERMVTVCEEKSVQLLAPRPGETMTPSEPPVLQRWWEMAKTEV